MKKLLVIGKEGRLARYTADSSLFDRYDIVYVPVGTDDGTILELHSDANYILVDAVADVSFTDRRYAGSEAHTFRRE